MQGGRAEPAVAATPLQVDGTEFRSRVRDGRWPPHTASRRGEQPQAVTTAGDRSQPGSDRRCSARQ